MRSTNYQIQGENMEKTNAIKSTTRKFKWFWPWQDEQEEEWLRALSLSGLHLVSSDGAGFYTFLLGEPSDIVYRLDYNALQKKDKDQYLQLFKDASWEFVGEMNGWQYFRKPAAAGESEEIFTNNESKIQKYKRFLYATLAFMPIYLIFFTIIDFNERPLLYGIVLGLFAVCFALLCGIALKVYLRIGALKKL
jgi:hypothetical protein